jgi:hypothetical protein
VPLRRGDYESCEGAQRIKEAVKVTEQKDEASATYYEVIHASILELLI